MIALVLVLVLAIASFPVGVSAAEDYRAWKQSDSRWGSIKMGSTSITIGSEGCLVTAVTKLIIQAGFRDPASFTVATLANWLNSNDGYDGNALKWAKPSQCVSGFKYHGSLASGSFESADNNGWIITQIQSGYHVVLEVNNGKHWVAVDEAKTLATGTVYIMDSLKSGANADITLAEHYTMFQRAMAYTGGTTPTGSYTVTFNANGGSCTTTSKTVSAGGTIGTLPTPTRAGYKFIGWYASKNEGYNPVTSATAVNQNTTLYAFWSSSPYYTGNHVTFDVQGGQKGKYIQSVLVTEKNAARDNQETIIFDSDNTLVATNYWGAELAVGADGGIVGKRGYNVETQLTVPAGGFVLSIHADDISFYNAAEIGDYVGYKEENGKITAYLYDNQNDYLLNHKYVKSGNTYGGIDSEFPVTKKEGYLLKGWYTEAGGGEEVKRTDVYGTSKLYAHWEAEEEATPSVTVTDPETGRRYERYEYLMSWKDAKDYCESVGGHLVTITSEAELELLKNGGIFENAKRGMYYIGLTDEEEEDKWKWVTGEAYEYDNFDPDYPEPSGGEVENYASMVGIENPPNKQVGEWNDVANNHMVGYYSSANTGFICEYENSCAHHYESVKVDATCKEPGYTFYICTECEDSYVEYDGESTDWATVKPEGIAEERLESKTQYRYADKETTTSYDANLSGWTKTGSNWQQNGSGTVQYVKSWPAGFSTSHSLYSTYHKNAKTASESGTDKTTINSDNITGYLYYHWCRGTYTNGPIDRGSKDTKQGEYTAFHAFYSTTNPNTLTAAPDRDGSYQNGNGNCCKDSHWYYYVPVYTQSYTTYRNQFSYERWTAWSEWSDTVYIAGDNRKVETRTLYRYVEGELGDHKYENGFCVVCGEKSLNRVVEGVLKSYADDTATIILELVNGKGDVAYTTTAMGNSTGYTFVDVTPAPYTLRVSKANHVTRSYEIVVGTADLTQNVILLPVGDITGDGKVTATDYSRLLAHVKKTGAIADSYLLLSADVTGDGKITATDYSRLLAHVKKVSPLW